MKILFILPEFEPHTGGGICTYYRELLKGNKNWQSTVLQGSSVEVGDIKASWEDIPVICLRKSLFDKYVALFNHFSIFPELQRHLASAWAMYEQAYDEKINFDAVVCTDWGFGFIPWIIKKDKPVIVHLHGSCGQIDYFEPRKGLELWSKIYLNIETNLLKEATALLTYSNQNKLFWEDRFSGTKEINIVAPAFAPKEIGENKKTKTSNNVGLVIGRIQFWKGPILLCEALKLLTETETQNLKIYWIGRDTHYHNENISMDKYLRTHFPQIWGKIIEPLGSKNQTEITQIQNNVSWGLVPSVWDMFNFTAIEHLASGIPLLCSKSAGAAGFLNNNLSTLCFETTPQKLAEAIRIILNKNNAELALMGTKGKHTIRETFNVDNLRKQHFNILTNTINTYNSNKILYDCYEWLTPPKFLSLDKVDSAMALSNYWPLKKLTKITFNRLLRKVNLKK